MSAIPTDITFEKSFLSLAQATNRDKVPALQKYMVGFQVLQKDDDDTRAVGVFGYKVGKDWYFAPVFFLRGQLKGTDLLYSHSDRLFVPLDDGWVSYFTNKDDYSPASPARIPEGGSIADPDFSFLTDVPGSVVAAGNSSSGMQFSTKSAAMLCTDEVSARELDLATHGLLEKLRKAAESVFDLRDMFAQGKKPSVSQLCKRAGVPGLPDILRVYPQARKKLAAQMRDVDFTNAVLQFYDVGDLAPKSNWRAAQSKRAEAARPAPEADLVVVQTPNDSGYEQLSPEGKIKVLDGEQVIEDRREVTSTLLIDDTSRYSNPSGSGVWDVLLQNGKTIPALVCCDPYVIGEGRTQNTCVVYAGADGMCCARTNDVWVTGRSSAKFTGRSIYDVEQGARGLVLLPNGRTSLPCAVVNRTRGDVLQLDVIQGVLDRADYGTGEVKDVASSQLEHGDYSWRIENFNRNSRQIDCDSTAGITLSPRTVTARCSGRMSFLSDNCRWLAIAYEKGTSMLGSDADGVEDYVAYVKLQLGTASDVESRLFKVAQCLEVVRDRHGDYTLSTEAGRKHFTPKSAIVHLVCTHDLRVDDAIRVLGRCKRANTVQQVFVAPPAKSASRFTLPDSTHFDADMGMSVSEPISDTIDMRDDEVVDVTQDETVQKIMYAAQAGKKDIFDVALLKNLARAVDVDSIVSAMLPDMLRALDKIGRMLFLFYWHQQAFITRYGREELPDIEEGLRNVFKSLGETVLYLKQKTAISDEIAMGLNINLDETTE